MNADEIIAHMAVDSTAPVHRDPYAKPEPGSLAAEMDPALLDLEDPEEREDLGEGDRL